MSCECDQKQQWGCDGCHDVTFSLQCSPCVASGAGDSAGGRCHKLVSGETNLVLGRKVSVCSTTIPCHNPSYKPCRSMLSPHHYQCIYRLPGTVAGCRRPLLAGRRLSTVCQCGGRGRGCWSSSHHRTGSDASGEARSGKIILKMIY